MTELELTSNSCRKLPGLFMQLQDMFLFDFIGRFYI